MSEKHPKQTTGNDLTKHSQPLTQAKAERNPVILKALKYWEGEEMCTENSQLQ